jgi:hypothetical protein
MFESDVRLLVRQLDAISGQSSPLWRCVIVDDGSRDGEPGRLARAWCSGEPRARFVALPHNLGIAAATNRAVAECRSDFVVFADHDDVVSTDAVRAFAEYLRYRPDTDVLYSNETLVAADGRTLFEYVKPDWSPERFLGQPYVNHLTAIRTDLVRSAGLRTEREPCQDYDLLHRVLPAARHVGHVPVSLYRWRAVEGSTAKAASEKPNVARSVTATVTDALARAGEQAVGRGHPRDPNCVIVRRRADHAQVTAVPIGDGDTARVAATLAEIASGVAVLGDPTDAGAVADDVLAVDPETGSDLERLGWQQPLVAQVQRRDVCAAGPMLLAPGGRIRSVGRTLDRLDDPVAGAPGDSTGPWAAYLVAREVDALAPRGWTVDVTRLRELGGLRRDLPLDVAVAELSVRAAANGLRTIWTPQCTLTTTAMEPGRDFSPVLARLHAQDPAAWRTRYAV